MTFPADHDPITALVPEEQRTVERWMALIPHDAVHVRDGRTFAAGAGGAARTRQPWPSTVAGAVGAAVRDAGGSEEPRTLRGPLLALKVGTRPWALHFPVPADLVPDKKDSRRWHRLRPEEPSAARTDLDSSELKLQWMLSTHAGEPSADRWWGQAALKKYLHGEAHEDRDLTGAPQPLVTELRTGIAIQERRVLHSHMYATEFLRLGETDPSRNAQRQWAFVTLGEFRPGSTPPTSSSVRFGGAGRIADLQTCDVDPARSIPERPERFPDGRILVYLATPGIWRSQDETGAWRNTWRPQLPDGAELVSAAVNGPQHVARSGVDRRGELEYSWLQWAVPAGSVYLLQFSGATPEAREHAAKTWAARAHGRAWGEDTSNDDADGRRLATAGFGLILTGTWT
ncbi:hypothetical protein IDM40_20780 [Nocardiopsis sp. HNM0947]|uniref:Uncharacterized protein n=1 Tax=Nocardiopsis coralli TaxID=2772213 RepID=A0ABR9PB99_9ACTN|nr:type III-B CRISPR module-associated Cmr3 family protein [Nocardiopsis coralli]MBE3001109.1 hypothetical protein [Nocardiopsis coralli]